MSNIAVIRSIRKLGRDIKSARLRRRLPMSLVAERAGISVRTLSNLEKGETGVSIGHVAAVIAALGMGTPFSDIPELPTLYHSIDFLTVILQHLHIQHM